MAQTTCSSRQRQALRAIAHQERGAPAQLDAGDAKDCCREGWAITAPGDKQFRLTEAGREVLNTRGGTA